MRPQSAFIVNLSSLSNMAKKSSDEEKTTLAEAYISFQLQVKQKEIQQFQEEASQLEAKKQRFTQLREQLKEEQVGHISVLWKQAKELEQKLEQRDLINKEQVEQALQQNLELMHSQEKELAELRAEVSHLKEEVLVLKAEKHLWQEYKMVGSQVHQQQIQHLEAELAPMQRRFEKMADYFKCSQELTLNEIDKKTVHLIDETKQQAAERAINHLDKQSRQEIKENEWLKREVAIYTREVSILAVAVQHLEEENIERMTHLFDHRLDDLFEHRLDNVQISRNVFLTQAGGLGACGCRVHENVLTRNDFSGPRSAGAVDSISPPLQTASEAWRHQGQVRELETDESSGSSGTAPHGHTEEPLLYGSPTHLEQGPLHLGSLEHKLLCVVGKRLPMQPGSPRSTSATQDWPFTAKLIHQTFK
ncbi:hypothetical protein UPYG_G00124080 [Umbra pygmaea]|uniref:Coiled-coil domain-containing protein 83 n=1 Tax=Umbra pygmaea TaxID=75934 RepID=A0ABD0XMX4_UMBPY